MDTKEYEAIYNKMCLYQWTYDYTLKFFRNEYPEFPELKLDENIKNPHNKTRFEALEID